MPDNSPSPTEAPVPNVILPPLLETISRHWWVVLLRGAILIVLGVYALLMPGVTLAMMVWVLGAFLVVDGVVAMIAAALGKMEPRGWIIVRGAIVLLIGIAILSWPAIFGAVAAMVLVYFVAIGLVINGVLEIVVAVRDRKSIKGEGWLILSGVLLVLFGIVIAGVPLLAAEVMIRVAGVFAILFGATVVTIAFQLRRLPEKIAAAVGM